MTHRTLLALLGCLLPAAASWAAAPPAPLTPAQRELLRERDRLAVEARNLGREMRHGESAAALERKIALERRIFGAHSTPVADSLLLLAHARFREGGPRRALRAADEVVEVVTRLHGPGHWRVR